MSKIHKVIITAKDLEGLEIYRCRKCDVTKFIDGEPNKPIKCPQCDKLMWKLGKGERSLKMREILMGLFPVVIED